jgi:hypothetical protein
MQQPMKQPTATIHLHRRTNVVQPLIVYLVEVDGEVAASLTVGQRQAVSVAPGRHRLQAKALFWASPELEVEVEADASLTVEIAPDVKHLWNMVLRPSTFLQVEQAA